MRTRSPFVCEEKKRICTTLRFFFSFQPSKCKQASTSTSKTISKFHWCKAIEMTAICLFIVLPCQCVCTDSFIIHSWFTIIIVHAMSQKKIVFPFVFTSYTEVVNGNSNVHQISFFFSAWFIFQLQQNVVHIVLF